MKRNNPGFLVCGLPAKRYGDRLGGDFTAFQRLLLPRCSLILPFEHADLYRSFLSKTVRSLTKSPPSSPSECKGERTLHSKRLSQICCAWALGRGSCVIHCSRSIARALCHDAVAVVMTTFPKLPIKFSRRSKHCPETIKGHFYHRPPEKSSSFPKAVFPNVFTLGTIEILKIRKFALIFNGYYWFESGVLSSRVNEKRFNHAHASKLSVTKFLLSSKKCIFKAKTFEQ